MAALPAALTAYKEACVSAFNPSSTHLPGQQSAALLANARQRVANYFKCNSSEVIFTSGATEANTLALRQAERHNQVAPTPKLPLVICSSIEHPSVLATLKAQARLQWLQLVQCSAPRHGCVSIENMLSHLPTKNEVANIGPITLSLMSASNETGVLQDIPRLVEGAQQWAARTAPKHTVLVHTDAVQAIGRLAHLGEAQPWRMAHRISVSGHKIGGIPGIGVLIAKRGLNGAHDIVPLFRGGGQERGRRAGTENIPGAVSLAVALEEQPQAEETKRLRVQRDDFEGRILQALGHNRAQVIGGTQPRLPQTSLLRFPGCRAEAVMMALDMRGIACSTGSACSAGATDPSPALLSMGYTTTEASEALRFSFPRVHYTPPTMKWLVSQVLEVVRSARGLP